MILVDTSVWVDHLRSSDEALSSLLEEGMVACHPWILGELALGSIKNRSEFLHMLELLPQVDVTEQRKVLAFIERHRLYQRGLGWVDTQILVSAASWPCRIWTRDRRLAEAAQDLGIGWSKPATRE
ncbi:MAG: type II toxin-antitoxin system VapC family toxin [Spirochaetia bacterium]|jgi:predicted nucleic acid-binding protein|nr:type II toxin-antitoxin system VapC family toxin [Spirochaetia bacterium]